MLIVYMNVRTLFFRTNHRVNEYDEEFFLLADGYVKSHLIHSCSVHFSILACNCEPFSVYNRYS